MKKCTRCYEVKNLNDFHKLKRSKDGYNYHCKLCAKIEYSKYANENREKLREYDRNRASQSHRIEKCKRYNKDENNKERLRELGRNYYYRNKYKKQTHDQVFKAIRNGDLIKQPCEVCKDIKVEAHHDDYLKPLDVRWLCHKHHMEHHKNERERLRNIQKGE